MRKILFLMVCALGFTFLQAQNSKVTSAKMNMDSYLRDQNSDDLLKAKELIDEAVVNDETSGKAKSWYYKGRIYQLLAVDSNLSKTDPAFLIQALDAYQKVSDLNDPKFREKSSYFQQLGALSANMYK